VVSSSNEKGQVMINVILNMKPHCRSLNLQEDEMPRIIRKTETVISLEMDPKPNRVKRKDIGEYPYGIPFKKMNFKNF
jgi:hypothetical protein